MISTYPDSLSGVYLKGFFHQIHTNVRKLNIETLRFLKGRKFCILTFISAITSRSWLHARPRGICTIFYLSSLAFNLHLPYSQIGFNIKIVESITIISTYFGQVQQCSLCFCACLYIDGFLSTWRHGLVFCSVLSLAVCHQERMREYI